LLSGIHVPQANIRRHLASRYQDLCIGRQRQCVDVRAVAKTRRSQPRQRTGWECIPQAIDTGMFLRLASRRWRAIKHE
jgi:hypothetical protein